MTPTTITITELHRHTGAIVQRCENGEAFTVTRYGQPVAVLRPLTEAERAAEEK